MNIPSHFNVTRRVHCRRCFALKHPYAMFWNETICALCNQAQKNFGYGYEAWWEEKTRSGCDFYKGAV